MDFYHEGKRIRRKVGSKSAARSVYERLKTESREGRLVPKARKRVYPTVREIAMDRVEGFTGRGIKNERHYAAWWIEQWGDKRINEITADDLRKLVSRLREKGEWSDKTINHVMGHFRVALNHAVQSGKIDRNPMEGVKMLSVPRGHLRFLTEAEEARLKEIMLPAHYRLVRFAILTGLRREEQFSLRWEHIDLRNKVLTIPRSKHGDTRHVPLSDEAIEILKTIQSETRVTSPWCFPSLNPMTAIDPQNFYKRVYLTALEKAGIKDIVWHTLRHTCASRLVMAGVDIRTVQEIMGHKTLAMTMRYSHLSGDHLTRAVNRISKGGISEGTDTKTDKPENAVREGIV
ncbi:MAG: tyrosine-type recombinase/integrase [Nitrospiraceae bacterium]|nr:tyrosine-type recombinase/integrase [Nitrospiraceae bacterium]